HDKQVAAGFNVTDYKGLPDSSVRYYFITDPDGYKVEVIQNN
ncbi:MAG TPA: lactoylglutathione lyase, partial [Trichococcus flocculiformis]|nr:lactoylglutathione lyase [Trichococcus flocculiformis]